MSGFEIAGVVLGALPIVIEGLEMYRKGLGTVRTMKNYEETIENLLITFNSTRARYIFTCETLLAPLMLPQKQYTELINDPSARSWGDNDLRDALSDRLGPAHDSYIGLVQRVHRYIEHCSSSPYFLIKRKEALLKFAGKMEIEIQQNMKSRLPAPSATVPVNSSAQGFSQLSIQSSRVWARIRIGLENGGLERLLDAMEKDLFRLERLLDQSFKLPAIRKDRKRRTSKKPWLIVRESAQSLFTAFTKRWNCPCPAAHNALLRLDVVDTSKSPRANVHFDVLLSKTTPGTNNSSVVIPTWYNLRVISNEDIPQIPAPQPKPPGQTAQASVITFQVTSADELGFGLSRKNSLVVSKSVGTQIDDLCSKLQAKGPSKCLGYLEDTGWRHTISSTQQSTTSASGGIVKIYDLLGGRSNPGTSSSPTPGLSIREKYHLALSMSFAVLQLFNTPWFSSHESFHDIHLVTSSNNPAQPYILKELQAPHAMTPSTVANKMQRIGVQNELLFRLGVLLLEIAYGQPLSKLRQPADLDAAGNETILTDYLVAVRLADEIVNREPSKYSDAVRRCLFCRFPCTSTNLSDVELQEEFYGGVIAPLLEIYSFFS